jgi:hypothetical protein
MRECRTKAIVRTAHSKRLNVRVFHHSMFEYHIELTGKTYRYPINRYMVHVPDAYYAPIYRFVLDRSTKSVIASDMLLKNTNLALEGFGDTVERFPDGCILINFLTDDTKITGPVICVSPWGSFSNLIMHVLMGIVHCDDLLGIQYPILVPYDLPVWQRRCLALIGVDEDRMIRVPRGGATHVTEAYVPSKSFNRSSFFDIDSIDHGFFFEPYDLKSYSRRVIENVVNLGPEDDDDHEPARVLYIARKDASVRFTTNEAEAVEALRSFGVRYVLPTELPIGAMARAIHQADVVISAFGSAILNIAAARPGTTLIEIDHPAQDWCGRRICQILGYRHVICTRYRGERGNFKDVTSNPVNISELFSLTKHSLSRSSSKTPL